MVVDNDYCHEIPQFFVLANLTKEKRGKPILRVLDDVLSGLHGCYCYYYPLNLNLLQVLLPRLIDSSQVNSYSSHLIPHFPDELQKNKVFKTKTKNA